MKRLNKCFLFMCVCAHAWGVKGPAKFSFTKNHCSHSLLTHTKAQYTISKLLKNSLNSILILYRLQLEPCVAPSSEEAPNAIQTLTVSL